MGAQLAVTARNDLSELARVGGLVEEFGQQHGIPAKVVFEMNLALDEILTNVISYAYDDEAPHEIAVRLVLEQGHAVLQVEDDGRPFNPLAVAAPDLAQPVKDRRVGGLGVFLVRKVMDGLEYRRERDRNILVMRKAIAADVE